MWVEQAVFTSAQTRHARGYHLVARSPGIHDRLAQTLAVWAPTHDSLLKDSVDFHSLNYFVAEEEWGVLSRTVYGPSEYSSRGGFRLETNLLVVHREQLDGYSHNPHALLRTALALGHLRLRTCAPTTLERIELPTASVLGEQPSHRTDGPDTELTEQILHHLPSDRVTVIGAREPSAVIRNVLNRLPREIRETVSFTTGLKPSLHRSFALQFLPSAASTLRQELASAGTVCIDAE